MKRVGRYSFTAATVLSLLLCLTFIAASAKQWAAPSSGLDRLLSNLGVRRYPSLGFGRYRQQVAALTPAPATAVELEYAGEGLVLHVFRPRPPERGPPYEDVEAFGRWETPRHAHDFHHDFAGFEVTQLSIITRPYAQPSTFIGYDTAVTVPHWFAIAATTVLPALGLRRYRRQRVQKLIERGMCPACGYDLRASPDRCPECGAERTAFT